MTVLRQLNRVLQWAVLGGVSWMGLSGLPVAWGAEAPAPIRKPLEATISTSKYLPPEMYGQWSVTASLVEANVPDMFSPLVYEIWMLEQTGTVVTLSNPTTGASATISVDKVDGNTASFHRTQYAPGRMQRIGENPVLTVMENVMNGYSYNKLEYLKNGQVTKGFYAKYAIQAERINNGRVRFGSPEPPPMEFEIEKVRREPG